MAVPPKPATAQKKNQKKPRKQHGEGPKPLVGIAGLALFVLGVLWLVRDLLKPKPKKKRRRRGH